MLTETKFRSYVLYAVGEILLVVIGILIALQINNWNEDQKGKAKANRILEDIRSDMLKDLQTLEELKGYWEREIMYFKSILPSFNSHSEIPQSANNDTLNEFDYPKLFQYDMPFRSNTSSFDAMIADGNSNLITNDSLFSNIQRFYTFNVPTNENLFQILRQNSSDLNYKYAHILTYKPYKVKSDLRDEHIIADLNIFFESKNFYYWRTFIVNKKMLVDLISDIEQELESNN